MSEFPPLESEPTAGPQIVPHNREAEEAVLGSILINPEAYYDVAEFLEADDFYIHRHRWIWDAFKRLIEKREPIDFLTVTTELEQQNQLAEIGGAAYLTALMSNVPSALHAVAYGRIIEETAVRRRMLDAANLIAKLAYDEENGLESVMDDAEKAVGVCCASAPQHGAAAKPAREESGRAQHETETAAGVDEVRGAGDLASRDGSDNDHQDNIHADAGEDLPVHSRSPPSQTSTATPRNERGTATAS